jgi:hypothetical protein
MHCNRLFAWCWVQTQGFLRKRRGGVTIQKEPHIWINCSALRYMRRDQFILSMNIVKTALTTMAICCRFIALLLLCLLLSLIVIKLCSWNGGEFSTKLSEISDRIYLHITELVTPCESEQMTHETSVRCFTIPQHNYRCVVNLEHEQFHEHS